MTLIDFALSRDARSAVGLLPALLDRQMLDLIPFPPPDRVWPARMVTHDTDHRLHRLGDAPPPRHLASAVVMARHHHQLEHAVDGPPLEHPLAFRPAPVERIEGVPGVVDHPNRHPAPALAVSVGRVSAPRATVEVWPSSSPPGRLPQPARVDRTRPDPGMRFNDIVY